MLIDKELIQQAKEKLGDENFKAIMEFLGVEDYDLVRMKCLCPVHKESTASFIYDAKHFRCKCFGCGASFDFIEAAMHGRNTSFLGAVRLLFERANIPFQFGEYGIKTRRDYKYPHEEPVNQKENVYRYMALRGISKETVDYADIREDKNGNCVFNYYDTNDVLTNVKYRPSHKIDKKNGKAKMWWQPDADTTPLLYGIHRVNTAMPLLVTEGEIDSISAIEAGYLNAVSIPFGANNFTWMETNWDFLEQFDCIIIASDNDEPGRKMQKECVSRLGSWRTKTVEIPETMTDNKTGEIVKVKDLNEVLYYGGKEAVMSVILNAKDSPVSSVTDLSDISDMDLDNIDGVTLGIKPLDTELMKIFNGTLTLVSGMPGAGKTSFLYQAICHAMDSGVNCWLFSRELPGWMSRNWFNYILAGPRNVVKRTTSEGAVFWKVMDSTKSQIASRYRGQWYVYNDGESNKISDLLNSMSDVVRKYGVKLLILDNMMTIDLESSAENELKKQTECVNSLIQFAMKYSVAVILVVHPRKLMAGVSDVGLHDLAGSSNITNLAHRTLSLRRITQNEKEGIRNKRGEWVKPPNPYDVEIRVLKDRMCGRSGFTCGVYYDIPSRRFFTRPEEYDRQYKWDTRTYTEPLSYPILDPVDKAFGEENADA